MTFSLGAIWRKWTILFVLSLALAIIIIDTTLLNVSLSAIIKDLHTDLKSIQWVITAYSLTLAALTITGGRLGDFFGRKRMFMVGAVIFAIGSFISSISVNVPMMIAGEAIIEGIGAALMLPATSSLLIATYRGRDRAVAFGIWGGIAAGAAALGPILGGILTTYYSWRWGFRINVVVAAILLVGARYLPESSDHTEKPQLDWLGIFLSAAGLTTLVFGIVESSTYGWWKATTPFVIAGTNLVMNGPLSIVPFAILIGLIILLLFITWELKREEDGNTPLVSMRLFSNQQFRSGSITTLVMALGQAGLFFSVPVFLQAVRGYDALTTGLSLLPLSIALLIAAPLSANLSKYISPKHLIQAGLLLNIIAYVVIRFSLSISATPWTLAPGMILFGVGMGLVMAQISNLTLSAISVEKAGEASGVNNTLRQLGSTLGSAVIGAVLLSSLASHAQTGITNSTIIPEQMKPALLQATGQQSASLEFGGLQTGNSLPAAVTTELTNVVQTSTVTANQDALIYGIVFAVLGLLVSFQLPNIKNVERPDTPVAGH